MRIHVDKDKLRADLKWLFINVIILFIIIFTLSYDYNQYFGDPVKIKWFFGGVVAGFFIFGFVRGTIRFSFANRKDD